MQPPCPEWWDAEWKGKQEVMKYAYSLAMAGAAIWLAGCSSLPKVAITDPIGPAPTLGAASSGDGSLVVYSARVPAAIDLNQDEWVSNNDFGMSNLTYGPAHTRYTIYAKNGALVQTVFNSRDATDASPAIVTLAPGAYHIEAQAIDCKGARIEVELPVVIRAGEMTVAHLEGGWHPQGRVDNEVAKLPCGRPIGWLAPSGEFASVAR
jgi:hypothetical protein